MSYNRTNITFLIEKPLKQTNDLVDYDHLLPFEFSTWLILMTQLSMNDTPP